MKVKLIRDWSGAKAFTDIHVSKGTATYLKSIGIIDNSTVIDLVAGDTVNGKFGKAIVGEIGTELVFEKKRPTRKKKQN